MQENATFVNHLEELRRRLIVSGLAALILGVLSFFVSDFLVEIIRAPIQQSVHNLYFLSPYEAFLTKLKISVVSGIVLASPVIFTQLWKFVSPGLYQHEKRIILPLVISSTALFILGILFAYFVVIPTALKFFLDFQTQALVPLISIGSYISFFLSFIFTFGIMFDVPVVLVGLIWLRVLGTQFLVGQRKVVIVLIFVLAAILTPTADVLTQCFLALPLWFLFEISIWIGKLIEKKQGR